MSNAYRVLAEKYTQLQSGSFGITYRNIFVEYGGKTYRCESEYVQETDNNYYLHTITDRNGKYYVFDFDAHDCPTEGDVYMWLRMGKPSRGDLGINYPIDRESLKDAYAKYIKTTLQGSKEAGVNLDV